MPKRDTAKLVATLQRYRKEAAANRNFSGGKRGNTFLPLFAKYPPEVQKVCREYLNSLCLKHKDRLEANYGRYYGVLVATATRMALDKLGLRQISKKGFQRGRDINRIKVFLGIQDKNPDKRYTPGKVYKPYKRSNVSHLAHM